MRKSKAIKRPQNRVSRRSPDVPAEQAGRMKELFPEAVSEGKVDFANMDKEQSFYICLDDKVRLEDVRFLNLTRDMLFVCRDVALDDETAANLALQCRLRTI